MNLNSNILHLQTEHLEMDRDVLLLVVQFIGTLVGNEEYLFSGDKRIKYPQAPSIFIPLLS